MKAWDEAISEHFNAASESNTSLSFGNAHVPVFDVDLVPTVVLDARVVHEEVSSVMPGLEQVGALAAVTTHVSVPMPAPESDELRASILVEIVAYQDSRVSILVLAIGVDSSLEPLDLRLPNQS